jgi:hypothetical protein
MGARANIEFALAIEEDNLSESTKPKILFVALLSMPKIDSSL